MEYQFGTSRRQMLKLMAAATAPLLLPACATVPQRRVRASNTITLGSIGIGMMGGPNLNSFLGISDCHVVAVADVDDSHLAQGVNQVNSHYQNKDCKGYKDYRDLLARPDIDAVCISVPDHWHSIIAIAAAKAGKDIYCEKPLSKTLNEGIAMVKAVEKHDCIWQTGSWQRSQGRFRWAAQLVQNGYLGKVTHVEIGLPSGHSDFGKTGNKQPNGNPPPGVDYNFWTGPSKMMPFNPCRFHKNWRWNYNTGGGQLMDWIGHHCDIAHWGLANPKYGCGPDDAIGPSEVSATAKFPAKTDVWNTATHYRIECKYPNDVQVLIADAQSGVREGAKWIGSNGWVAVSRDYLEASDPQWIRDIQAREKKGDLEIQLYKSPGHQQEFIDSVKSRKRTLTPIQIAHRSQSPGHLGYIASVVGRKLRWDAHRQIIIGDPEATKLLSRPMRAPWHI